ncbi:MAG: hypothetical protein V4555_09955, partial [Acidobacteriota bacterium]
VLEAGTTAYAGPGIAASTSNASKSLLTNGGHDATLGYYTTTDVSGKFSISSNYTCDTGRQVYLYSVGGNTGSGSVNSAAGLMAVLGTCGTDFSSATTVNMNEVSTIAAAYAMAGFATDATHVSTSGSALASTGIRNAFANANQIFDISTNPFNKPNTAARTVTPNSGVRGGTGTVPQQQVNTLANILATCINTSSSGSTQCTTLFSKGKSRLSTSATDTATEAIYMAQNPANATVYNLVGAQPYTPYYNTAPSSLAIILTFSGAGHVATTGQANAIAIDGSGNAWAISANGSVLSEFSPLGIPANTTGYSSLNGPTAVAVDASSAKVWVSNTNDGNAVAFTIAGGTTQTYSLGSNALPMGMAIDGSGNIWFGDDGSAHVVKLSSAGTILATGGYVYIPLSLAVEPGATGNVWEADGHIFANLLSNSVTVLTPAGTPVFTSSVAIDANGNAWFTIGGASDPNQLVVLNAAGTSRSDFFPAGGGSLNSLAIDGANNVWAAENSLYFGTNQNYLLGFTSAGTAITASPGVFVGSGPSPDAFALDGSGNAWFTSITDGNLYEVIGLTTPVVTPIAYGVANSKLGQRP